MAYVEPTKIEPEKEAPKEEAPKEVVVKKEAPKKEMREADQLVGEVQSWWGRSFVFIRKTKIRTWKGVAILAFVAGVAAAIVWLVSFNVQTSSDAAMRKKSPLMKDIKDGGCVADGILSDYGGQTEKEIKMIKNSECLYLHRALETWAAPPNFERAKEIMEEIQKDKPDMIFGMFLAEAINPSSQYYYPNENRNFNFSKMCRKGSEGFWGENTCKGYFGSSEYQKYLKYITRRAIDMGIQSFMFGQIFFQDNSIDKKWYAKDIVEEMRSYAREKNKEIVIGAQTNDIEDQNYLKLFDFIEGGVGINELGKIEDQPCFSKWWKKEGDRCWALLWNDRFSKKANDVLLHLDWSGFYDDDMSIFSRMPKGRREKTVENLYDYFHKQGMGFMLPYLAVINENNESCYGPAKNYYSASDEYSCRDEDAWNEILEKALKKDEAEFVDQSVPLEMIAGNNYRAEITMKNTGRATWTEENQFRLGAQNPMDNDVWGGRIKLKEKDKIEQGEEATFVLNIEAPKEPGVYNFQWQMVEEGKEWFGEKTENLEITVSAKPEEENTEENEVVQETQEEGI